MRFSRQKFEFAAGQYRSGLEKTVREELDAAEVSYSYEPIRIEYTTKHTYTPDIILKNGIILELKGYFDSDDRTKMKLVKTQHPELDIRFVFSNSKTKISKGSKTTYGDWCRKNGFPFADKSVPKSWINERGKKSN